MKTSLRTSFEKLLSGGDLRSLEKSQSLLKNIKTQEDFDELFTFLYSPDRLVVMRAADCLEKISATAPEYLKKHKNTLFQFCKDAANKEFQWHLALMLPRLPLSKKDLGMAWDMWDPLESTCRHASLSIL